jgi:hypothetical protein
MKTDKTAGFDGWAPMKFFMGKGPDGQKIGREGFRNVVNGEECKPENGWNGAPPYPTGDLATVRHASDAYRRGYEEIRWESASPQSGS